MLVGYRRLISYFTGAVLIASAIPAAADNSGTVTSNDIRKIQYEITTEPAEFSIEISETLGTTAKVDIVFVQETKIDVERGMVGHLNNITDRMMAAGLEQRLKELLMADIAHKAEFEKYTQAHAQMSDKEYTENKKALEQRLIGEGYESLGTASDTIGTITVEYTAWVRKSGWAGDQLGEVRGTVKLKLDAEVDWDNFIFLGGFEAIGQPNFQTRNGPRSREQRRKAREQFVAFQARFNRTLRVRLRQLNGDKKLFRSDEDRQIFLNSEVGSLEAEASKKSLLSIPFMGSRNPWNISVNFTAGELIPKPLDATSENLPAFEESNDFEDD